MPSLSSSSSNRPLLSLSADASSLIAVLNYFHPLQPEAAEFFTKNVVPMRVPRKGIILREGEVCDCVYFIRKGAVRGFTREGRLEITTWITVEDEMVTSIASLTERAPAAEYMQAIEDCELLVLPFEKLEQMYDLFPEFNTTTRKLLQRYYWDAERRAFIARLTKAESKYRHFLMRHAHLANRIPLKYIASYLGMTMETLSRIRKKLSEKA